MVAAISFHPISVFVHPRATRSIGMIVQSHLARTISCRVGQVVQYTGARIDGCEAHTRRRPVRHRRVVTCVTAENFARVLANDVEARFGRVFNLNVANDWLRWVVVQIAAGVVQHVVPGFARVNAGSHRDACLQSGAVSLHITAHRIAHVDAQSTRIRERRFAFVAIDVLLLLTALDVIANVNVRVHVLLRRRQAAHRLFSEEVAVLSVLVVSEKSALDGI
jgi:hypothetical protein